MVVFFQAIITVYHSKPGATTTSTTSKGQGALQHPMKTGDESAW